MINSSIFKGLEKKRDEGTEKKNRLCAEGDHQGTLTGWGFSGGMVHFKCSHCGRIVSEPDLPMSI